MRGDTVIRTWGLTKRFGRTTAVDNLTMEVPRGEVFGFLGPNGAGKTTTIAMLLGLVHPTSGGAEVLGCDIRKGLGAALRRTGATIESPAFYPYLSGRDNLRVMALADGGSYARRIDEVLERVGLGGRGDDPFKAYSMGMKQRLALAAALLNDPEFLILDEPTNGLDPAGIQETRTMLRQMVDEQGKSVFLSSHLLHEVQQVCDRVVIIDRGHVVAQGRVDELLRQREAIEVELTEAEVERAESVLGRLGWVQAVRRDGTRLHVSAPAERSREVAEALAASRVYPTQLRRVSATLEDLFLTLTRDSGDA
jgi:ABC-2 type transport system ATP-binding protein